jgi:membrane protein implicated in regulation of membrane protease activity
MSWSDFYLLCFLVGFSLSVLSFLAGAVHIHLPFKMHFPFHGGHHAGGVHHAGGAHHTGASAKGGSSHPSEISWFNASTIMAFLAWFGGAGYILTRHAYLAGITALLVAIASGLFGGWMVYRFMSRLMEDTKFHMNDWDYRLEGAVGVVSMTIRQKQTGEVIFEQNGVRKSVGARSEDGSPIEKGSEVAIGRYEKGIAYVRKWEEFSK